MKRILAALLILVGATFCFSSQLEKLEAFDDHAPNTKVDKLIDKQDYATLGLENPPEEFKLNDIHGDVLVLELFNRFCYSCWQQAGHMEALWRRLGEEDLRDRVKLLALGQGNSSRGVKSFKNEHKISYPMGADPKFSAIDAFGDPGGTPLSIYLVKNGEGWTVSGYHIGNMKGEVMLSGVKKLLDGEAAPFTAESGVPASMKEPAPEVSEKTRMLVASSILGKMAGGSVKAEKMETGNGETLYRAVAPETGPLELYVRISTRKPVCDLCHTNIFAFGFDSSGQVMGFAPIYVTKVGNEKWSDEDKEGFEKRLLGRKMAKLGFDPDIDAVTGASMSSSLIYDEIRRTGELLEGLEKAK